MNFLIKLLFIATFSHSAIADSHLLNKCTKDSSRNELTDLAFKFLTNEQYKESFNCSFIGSQRGIAVSQSQLGYLYFYGLGVKTNIAEAVRLYKLAAEQNDDWSLSELGYLYGQGIGVEKNNKEAVRYLLLAADQGNDNAQSNLAWHYANGLGAKKNLKEAIRLYKIAADAGNTMAIGNLGWHYSVGEGVKKNYKEAIRLFRSCAKENDAYCFSQLAYLYREGKGVNQDDEESVRLLLLAVQQDDTWSMADLGWHYANGYGVKKDLTEAIRLYKKAAEENNKYAQGQLGWHYENGKGIKQDFDMAYYYYNLAAKNGDDFATESLKKLLEKKPFLENKDIQIAKEKKNKKKEDYFKEGNKKETADAFSLDYSEENADSIIIEGKLNNEFASNRNITSTKQISKEEDQKIKLTPVESEFLVTKNTSIRILPSSDSGRVRMMEKNTIIYIPGKVIGSDWYSVENEGGVKIGYIYKSSIKEVNGIKPPSKGYAVDWGPYYALVIGNDKYKNFNALTTPIVDVKAIGKTLQDKYGFKVEVLTDGSREDILDKLYEYRSILTTKDNLLIYYAGHGDKDEYSKEGYWQPIGSKPNRPSTWISNSEIITYLRALKAKHIIVIVDSCFSGAILRTKGDDGGELEILPKNKLELEKFYKKKNDKISRVAITSGNLEPVPDSLNNSDHSPFAKSLIDILEDNDDVLLSSALFVKLETYLTQYSNFQETLYSPLAIEDHNYGGHFIFVPN